MERLATFEGNNDGTGMKLKETALGRLEVGREQEVSIAVWCVCEHVRWRCNFLDEGMA